MIFNIIGSFIVNCMKGYNVIIDDFLELEKKI
jgi:hypothetical protein